MVDGLNGGYNPNFYNTYNNQSLAYNPTATAPMFDPTAGMGGYDQYSFNGAPNAFADPAMYAPQEEEKGNGGLIAGIVLAAGVALTLVTKGKINASGKNTKILSKAFLKEAMGTLRHPIQSYNKAFGNQVVKGTKVAGQEIIEHSNGTKVFTTASGKTRKIVTPDGKSITQKLEGENWINVSKPNTKVKTQGEQNALLNGSKTAGRVLSKDAQVVADARVLLKEGKITPDEFRNIQTKAIADAQNAKKAVQGQ